MVTAEEHLQNLVASAFGREMEVYYYQVNVDNYAGMLLALPTTDWPGHLQDYRATPVDLLPASMSDEDETLITDLQFRDRIRGLLRTEKAEQSKAQRVLDVLKLQIGADYDTLLAAHKAAQV